MFAEGMILDVVLVIASLLFGWGLPQPLWVQAAWKFVKAWIAKIRNKKDQEK